VSNFSRFTKPVRSCSRIMFYKMLFDRFMGFAYLYTVLDMPRQIRIVCLHKVAVLCFVNNGKTQHRARAISLPRGPRPFAPGSESCRCRTFAPWNFCSLELSLPGTFQANGGWSESTQPGAKVPAMELSLPLANRARNGSVVNCN